MEKYVSMESLTESTKFKEKNNIKNCCVVVVEIMEENNDCSLKVGELLPAFVLKDHYLIIDCNYAYSFDKAKIVSVYKESDLTH